MDRNDIQIRESEYLMDRNDIQIRVSRNKLIETLKVNRDAHKAEYELAKKGFKIELKKELETMLKKLNEGKKLELFFKNRKPESYIGNYDEVIEMLEFAQNAEISLNQKDFQRYVKNDWDWKRSWDVQNKTYLLSASSEA